MGVDYSSSMVNIRDNHAYDIKNFLKINNVLRNRNGYEHVGKYKINGIWECNYEGETIIIAHIGTKLYRVTHLDVYDNLAANYVPIVSEDFNIEDNYSWGIYTNDRLYILCGEYCVVKFSKDNNGKLNFVVSRVFEDEDTYIPTTTINIIDVNKAVIEVPRTTLDAPNMLTNWRYNTINTFCGYDVKEKEVIDEDGNTTIEKEQVAIWGKEFVLDGKLSENDLAVGNFEITIQTQSGTIVGKSAYLGQDTENQRFAIVVGDEEIGTIGFFSKTHGLRHLDTIYLKEAYANINNTTPNITVKFKVNSNDYEIINKCKFGIMYGANGLRNRLFLTGNPKYPNVDYHSSQRNIYATDKDIDLQDSQDLTYFSVYDYCAYGTSNSKITDYQIAGNGDLIVLKENNVNETSIYFRNGEYSTDVNGNVVEQYPLKSGNIGRGAIPNYNQTLKNLNNDFVFISSDGVYGISSTTSANMLNSPYKYSYPRSNLINNKLKEYLQDSINIATIIDHNKYFITFKLNNEEYKTFVADGRYPYKLPESVDNEYEYEWFVLDNIKADKYYIINNTLYFTNEKGLYKLDLYKQTEKHVDIDNISITSGIISNETEYDTDTNTYSESIVTINGEYLKYLSNDAEFKIEAVQYSRSIEQLTLYDCEGITVKNGQAVVSNKMATYFNNFGKHQVYIRHSNGLEVPINIYPYEDLYEVNSYYLYLDKEQENLLEDGQYTVMVVLHNVSFRFEPNYNTEIEEDYFLINEYGYRPSIVGLTLNFELITGFNLLGLVKTKTNVDCYLLTKAFNMGQSLYNKNLKSITVVNDVESYSFVNLGIITKKVRERFKENVISGTEGITDTYKNIFKSDLTNRTFATSFTKNYFIKFNFIQFEFYNMEGTDCIINNINVVYTLGFKQGGVS